jgi:hypothetical protein
VIDRDKPNPFEILSLPTRASEADIAARAEMLTVTAMEAEKDRLYRWAREQVITHPRTRLEYEIFEMPGAIYHDPEWDRFEGKFARNPVDLRSVARGAAPVLADFDLVALISILLDGLLEVPEPDLGRLVANPPIDAGFGPPPVEVRDVIFG